jgi:hypothetical protein
LETCCGYEYDLARELFLPADFQGTSRAHQTQQKCWALPATKPYLRTNRFQGVGPLRRKENSAWGSRRRLRVQLRCRAEPKSRCRNINRLPFRQAAHECAVKTELPYGLGSTNPRPTAVHMEPFPTSVLQVLIEVFATKNSNLVSISFSKFQVRENILLPATKICTRGRSTRDHSLGFVTDLHACLLLRASFLP